MSFKTFTRQYVASLSSAKSESIYQLAKSASTDNLRLREPLYLYAATNDKVQTLLKATQGTQLHDGYSRLASKYDTPLLVEALREESPELPEQYHKVWRSYLSVAGSKERDERVKALIARKVRALQDECGLSTYRICKDLGLNNSNVNDWLKNEKTNKVSIGVARKVLSYVEATAKSAT